jgi:hypothetical protein
MPVHMSKENPAQTPPPSMQLFQFIWPGAMAMQAIYVAATLGIADHLHPTAKSIEALAAASNTHPGSLRRLLRSLKSIGIFSEDESGNFQNTPMSDCLRRDHPQSIRAWAVFLSAPFFWKSLGALHETVITGQTAVDRVFGKPFFTYLAEHSDDAAIFNAAMGQGSAMIAPLVVSAYDFSKFTRIVDVGGGNGTLLRGILAANPRASGVLFDLPKVVATASVDAEIIGGDFFDAVPAGGDAYVLKGVVHDWNTPDAVRILKNCRRAIRPDGTLLLVEGVMQSGEPNPGNFMDVLMMTLTGGQERTESDFRSLLGDAGFSLQRVIPLGPTSLLECKPL